MTIFKLKFTRLKDAAFEILETTDNSSYITFISVSSRLLPPRQTVKFLVMSKWDEMMGQHRKGPWCLRDKSSMNSMTKNTESQIHYDNP